MIELGFSTLLISPHALAMRVHLLRAASGVPRGVARAYRVKCMLACRRCILSCICSRAYALVPYNQHASNSRVLRQNLLHARVFAAREC